MHASTSTTTTRANLERMSTGLLLAAAAASFLLSVVLWFSGNELEGIFVGLWVPSILSLGALVRPDRSHR